MVGSLVFLWMAFERAQPLDSEVRRHGCENTGLNRLGTATSSGSGERGCWRGYGYQVADYIYYEVMELIGAHWSWDGKQGHQKIYRGKVYTTRLSIVYT